MRSVRRSTRAVPVGVLLFAFLCFVGGPGCLFSERNDGTPPRYFHPGWTEVDSSGESLPVSVQIGRTSAAGHLGSRFVYRPSEYEYGFYEERVWSDLPVRYLERALSDEFYRKRQVDVPTNAFVPRVRVELTAFEEAFRPRHEVLVGLTASVEGPGGALMERSFEGRVPLPNASPEAMAEAMGEGLRDVIGQMGIWLASLFNKIS